ncbi:MAG TPA: hypothetical protein VLH87_02930 [Pyrinomonadaceae bacterium]|nr:hypothetical protein [Pyrinomonadaceae bacterium]
MSENNDNQRTSISNAGSIKEIADYWDNHSVVDHWDEMREVHFDVRAPRRITLEPEVYVRLQEQAEASGIPLATLANSWLKERLTDGKAA